MSGPRNRGISFSLTKNKKDKNLDEDKKIKETKEDNPTASISRSSIAGKEWESPSSRDRSVSGIRGSVSESRDKSLSSRNSMSASKASTRKKSVKPVRATSSFFQGIFNKKKEEPLDGISLVRRIRNMEASKPQNKKEWDEQKATLHNQALIAATLDIPISLIEANMTSIIAKSREEKSEDDRKKFLSSPFVGAFATTIIKNHLIEIKDCIEVKRLMKNSSKNKTIDESRSKFIDELREKAKAIDLKSINDEKLKNRIKSIQEITNENADTLLDKETLLISRIANHKDLSQNYFASEDLKSPSRRDALMDWFEKSPLMEISEKWPGDLTLRDVYKAILHSDPKNELEGEAKIFLNNLRDSLEMGAKIGDLEKWLQTVAKFQVVPDFNNFEIILQDSTEEKLEASLVKGKDCILIKAIPDPEKSNKVIVSVCTKHASDSEFTPPILFHLDTKMMSKKMDGESKNDESASDKDIWKKLGKYYNSKDEMISDILSRYIVTQLAEANKRPHSYALKDMSKKDTCVVKHLPAANGISSGGEFGRPNATFYLDKDARCLILEMADNAPSGKKVFCEITSENFTLGKKSPSLNEAVPFFNKLLDDGKLNLHEQQTLLNAIHELIEKKRVFTYTIDNPVQLDESSKFTIELNDGPKSDSSGYPNPAIYVKKENGALYYEVSGQNEKTKYTGFIRPEDLKPEDGMRLEKLLKSNKLDIAALDKIFDSIIEVTNARGHTYKSPELKPVEHLAGLLDRYSAQQGIPGYAASMGTIDIKSGDSLGDIAEEEEKNVEPARRFGFGGKTIG